MDKWIKVLMWLTAAVFFAVGAISVPFGPWLAENQGSNELLGWVTYLASIAIPWAIAGVIARFALKPNQD